MLEAAEKLGFDILLKVKYIDPELAQEFKRNLKEDLANMEKEVDDNDSG